jgi:hypothetical protein
MLVIGKAGIANERPHHPKGGDDKKPSAECFNHPTFW